MIHRLVWSLAVCLGLSIMPLAPERASAADTLLFPPASVFILPTNVVGKVLNSDMSPTFNVQDGVEDYSYVYTYHSLNYMVDVTSFHTFPDAERFGGLIRQHNPAFRRTPETITHPALPGEWLAEGDCPSNDGPFACLDVGAVFGNLTVDVLVGAAGNADHDRRVVHESVPLALTVEAQLLARAEAYSQHQAPHPTPSHSASHQSVAGSRRALHRLVATVDSITKACVDGIGITNYEMNKAAQGIIDATMMDSDSQQTESDCNAAMTSLGAVHLPTVLAHNHLAHELLTVDSDVLTGGWVMARLFDGFLQNGDTTDLDAAQRAQTQVMKHDLPHVQALLARAAS